MIVKARQARKPKQITPPMREGMATTAQAAAFLGKCRKTIVRWCIAGKLPAEKNGEGQWEIVAEALYARRDKARKAASHT